MKKQNQSGKFLYSLSAIFTLSLMSPVPLSYSIPIGMDHIKVEIPLKTGHKHDKSDSAHSHKKLEAKPEIKPDIEKDSVRPDRSIVTRKKVKNFLHFTEADRITAGLTNDPIRGTSIIELKFFAPKGCQFEVKPLTNKVDRIRKLGWGIRLVRGPNSCMDEHDLNWCNNGSRCERFVRKIDVSQFNDYKKIDVCYLFEPTRSFDHLFLNFLIPL